MGTGRLAGIGSVEDCLEACAKAKSLGDVYSAAEQFSSFFCFRRFFLLHLLAPHRVYCTTTLIHSYPEPWCQEYYSKRYFRSDPVLEYCRSRSVPVMWRDITVSDESRTFVNTARSHGIEEGMTFPIHAAGEWGYLTFNWHGSDDLGAAHLREAFLYGQLFTAHAHEAIRKLILQQHTQANDCELTQREKECLLWNAEGKTGWEISRILNISSRTVVFHLKNAMTKLGATNRAHAAVEAFPHLGFDPDILQRGEHLGGLVPVNVVTSKEVI